VREGSGANLSRVPGIDVGVREGLDPVLLDGSRLVRKGRGVAGADLQRRLGARLTQRAERAETWRIFDNTARGAALPNALSLLERLPGR